MKWITMLLLAAGPVSAQEARFTASGAPRAAGPDRDIMITDGTYEGKPAWRVAVPLGEDVIVMAGLVGTWDAAEALCRAVAPRDTFRMLTSGEARDIAYLEMLQGHPGPGGELLYFAWTQGTRFDDPSFRGTDRYSLMPGELVTSPGAGVFFESYSEMVPRYRQAPDSEIRALARALEPGVPVYCTDHPATR